jgi:hypothetical protein
MDSLCLDSERGLDSERLLGLAESDLDSDPFFFSPFGGERSFLDGDLLGCRSLERLLERFLSRDLERRRPDIL